MIIEIIRTDDQIMIGMIIGGTMVMIGFVMKIDSMIIEEMIAIIRIKISHHLGIMEQNRPSNKKFHKPKASRQI